jgi:tripartite-type tricarboxylate transporter receptor subunit TctC
VQLIGGNVPLMSDTIPGVLAHVKSGKLRALGVAIPKRSPHLPEVPTIAEQGYPDFESVGWIGLAAPAKTPNAILDQLNAEIRKMLADPAVTEKMNTLAFEPIGGSREEFARFIKAEIEKWTKVAKASGAKAD